MSLYDSIELYIEHFYWKDESELMYEQSKPIESKSYSGKVKIGYVLCGINGIGPVLLWSHDTWSDSMESWKGFVKLGKGASEWWLY